MKIKNKKKENYYDVLVHKLGITDDILELRLPIIKERIQDAAKLISVTKSTINASSLPSTRIQGINQCIHLSIGILFSGKTSDTDIDAELNSIKDILEFSKCDPTDIVSAAILKYLLDYILKSSQGDKNLIKEIKTISDTFDQINWFLNEDAIKKLEFNTGID